MAKDVPTPVITASLHAAFYSRGNGDFTGRVLSALRNQFGGHSVQKRAQEVTKTERRRDGHGEEVDENPLTEGLERLPVHPTTLTIFGATGDLSRRKLLPAIYNLAHEGALPGRFNLIGSSRSDLSTRSSASSRRVRARVQPPRRRRGPAGKLFADVRYVAGSFDQADLYDRLRETCEEFDEAAGLTLNRCFYLSTAPSFFPVIAEALGEHDLGHLDDAEVRLIVEKPIGTNLAEARELNQRMLSVFDETQIFRIDHYLGKETVQNVLAFRFANGMFEPVWNRNYVDHVQITAAEDIGVGSRAGYYDTAGAMRDLVQNHMLQLLTLLCMEPPVNFTADEVRDEKVKVLNAIKIPEADEVEQMSVRGRYSGGHGRGEDVQGYMDEKDVPEDSTTETYVALRLEVDNWRWAGVPMYLRHGKRLARKVTEIAVVLKPVPHMGFDEGGSVGVRPNTLVLTVQPNEGVSLQLGAKIPGTRMSIRPVNMDFEYGTSFLSQSPEAYERLIMDAMRGDATLFTRDDEVEAQWELIDPILRRGATRPAVEEYPAGSQGPDPATRS
jgi:glucose-6-phosphate 1-dehydrogenase